MQIDDSSKFHLEASNQLMSIDAVEVFGTPYSRTCQPVNNTAQDLLVPNPCIIEARGVDEDYATGRVATIGNDNVLDHCRARLQFMANRCYSSPCSGIDELPSRMSL